MHILDEYKIKIKDIWNELQKEFNVNADIIFNTEFDTFEALLMHHVDRTGSKTIDINVIEQLVNDAENLSIFFIMFPFYENEDGTVGFDSNTLFVSTDSLSYDMLRNIYNLENLEAAIKIELRHEMGHVLDNLSALNNYKTYAELSDRFDKEREEIEKVEDLYHDNKIDRLTYVKMYFECAQEKRANTLVGISTEDFVNLENKIIEQGE